MNRPSRENARLKMFFSPTTVRSSVPVSEFHSLMLSEEQLARIFFVGWNATAFTPLPEFKFLEVST